MRVKGVLLCLALAIVSCSSFRFLGLSSRVPVLRYAAPDAASSSLLSSSSSPLPVAEPSLSSSNKSKKHSRLKATIRHLTSTNKIEVEEGSVEAEKLSHMIGALEEHLEFVRELQKSESECECMAKDIQEALWQIQQYTKKKASLEEWLASRIERLQELRREKDVRTKWLGSVGEELEELLQRMIEITEAKRREETSDLDLDDIMAMIGQDVLVNIKSKTGVSEKRLREAINQEYQSLIQDPEMADAVERAGSNDVANEELAAMCKGIVTRLMKRLGLSATSDEDSVQLWEPDEIFTTVKSLIEEQLRHSGVMDERSRRKGGRRTKKKRKT